MTKKEQLVKSIAECVQKTIIYLSKDGGRVIGRSVLNDQRGVECRPVDEDLYYVQWEQTFPMEDERGQFSHNEEICLIDVMFFRNDIYLDVKDVITNYNKASQEQFLSRFSEHMMSVFAIELKYDEKHSEYICKLYNALQAFPEVGSINDPDILAEII